MKTLEIRVYENIKIKDVIIQLKKFVVFVYKKILNTGKEIIKNFKIGIKSFCRPPNKLIKINIKVFISFVDSFMFVL